MSVATHPWTFVHPACGRPALHATAIPRAAGAVTPAQLEHLAGQQFLYRDPDDVLRRDPLSCDACRALFGPLEMAAMTVEANWQRRA